MKSRSEIIKKAKRLRKDITDNFITAFHWNTACRKPEEPEIEADPDGEMQKIAEGIDKMLASEGESLPAKYLCADDKWRECTVVPHEEGEPIAYTAVVANGVRHMVPHHNVQFDS